MFRVVQGGIEQRNKNARHNQRGPAAAGKLLLGFSVIAGRQIANACPHNPPTLWTSVATGPIS